MIKIITYWAWPFNNYKRMDGILYRETPPYSVTARKLTKCKLVGHKLYWRVF